MALRQKSYTQATLEEAVRQVRNGEISQKKTAKKFRIPMITLLDHVNGRVSGTKPVVRLAMSIEMEKQFSSLLIDVADKGLVCLSSSWCEKLLTFAGLQKSTSPSRRDQLVSGFHGPSPRALSPHPIQGLLQQREGYATGCGCQLF